MDKHQDLKPNEELKGHLNEEKLMKEMTVN